MEHDVIVVGAGPAGMAAARTASEHGAHVLVLDEQPGPGGQIFRAIENNDPRSRPELGHTYHGGHEAARAFRGADVDYRPGTTVWHVSGQGDLGFTTDGKPQITRTKHIVLATGAMERPFPIEGWTKAGVMTVGAAQILLKASGTVIEGAVFAGTGPLLYHVVHQYLLAGVPVKAVLDLTPAKNYRNALRHLPAAFGNTGRLAQGLKWKRRIVRSGVPLITGIGDLRIAGDGSVQAVEYLRNGSWIRIETENVLLHHGVVPNVNISVAAGCATRWDDRQAAWTVDVDEWFRSSQPGISVVGDGANIGGAVAAEHAGHLAALGALEHLQKIDTQTRDRLARPHLSAYKSELRLRPFLETLFRPPQHFRVPDRDDAVICRCEEITLGRVRELARSGCTDPNQLKSISRCGMGPCQGRMCGHTVSELLAQLQNKPVGEVGYFRLRPPIKPLQLNELAALASTPEQH